MEAQLDESIRVKVHRIFDQAAFIQDLGIELRYLKAGSAAAEIEILAKHGQQNQFVHAGVITTLADHTAGAAGESLTDLHHRVLTAEFKVNFLRPAKGERLWCFAQTLKPGRTLIVVESEVFCGDRVPDPNTLNGGFPLNQRVAKAMVTLAVVPNQSHEFVEKYK